jgi:hypothetical protein
LKEAYHHGMGSFLLGLAAALAPFTLLAVLALRYGAESRPGFDERRHVERPNI